MFPLLVWFLFCRRRREQKEEEAEEEEEEDENSNSSNSCGEEDEEAEEEEDAWSLNVDCLGAGFLKCHYCFSLQQSVGGIIFFLLPAAQGRFCRGTCVATFVLFCFVCAFSVLRLDTPFSALACWKEGRKFACILAFLLA